MCRIFLIVSIAATLVLAFAPRSPAQNGTPGLSGASGPLAMKGDVSRTKPKRTGSSARKNMSCEWCNRICFGACFMERDGSCHCYGQRRK